jgi:Protein of unknown function (DUF429)
MGANVSPLCIYGIDFTSSPRKSKPLFCASAELSGNYLVFREHVERWEEYLSFERYLAQKPSFACITSIDAPLGLPRPLVEQLEIPHATWHEMVRAIASRGRDDFVARLTSLRELRPIGSKYIFRESDRAAGSSSPMKLVNPPVALMFYEAATRLVQSPVVPWWIQRLEASSSQTDAHCVVEAYPALFARRLQCGSYKSEAASKETKERYQARQDIVRHFLSASQSGVPFKVVLPERLEMEAIKEFRGDYLDSLLCVLHGALYAVTTISKEYDHLEGTILSSWKGLPF